MADSLIFWSLISARSIHLRAYKLSGNKNQDANNRIREAARNDDVETLPPYSVLTATFIVFHRANTSFKDACVSRTAATACVVGVASAL